MYDTDRPLEANWRQKAKSAGFIEIPSTPCFEALLLQLLGESAPDRSDDCKRAFAKHLNDHEKFDYRAYQKIFPKELLSASTNPALETLLEVFSAKD